MRLSPTSSETSVRGWPSSAILTRERVIACSVAIAFLGLALFIGLRWFEHAVSIHPVQYDARLGWMQPSEASDVWFTTTDGLRLHGWLFKSSSQPATATIIYFHGNGGNISNVGWVGERLASKGFNVLLMDYRGYGRSEGNADGEQGLYADAEAGYEYVTKTLSVRPEGVVLFGQSLGTAVATDVASRKKCGAVILESGFSSASDLATDVLPLLPRQFHFLTRNRFESARKLAQVNCPVLITHGDPDETIPAEHGHRLFAAANEPKKLLIFPGAGHNVFGSQGNRYLDLVSDFIQKSLETNR
jgi:uncharacterized protein